MSHLTENEQQFMKEFLKLMSDENVQALMSTVTRRMVKADSREACVEAILLHSASLDEFLKRQKVTKENLFKYLNERKISVPNTDKAALELQIKELVSKGSLNHAPTHRSTGKDVVPTSPWGVAEHVNNPIAPMQITNHHPFGDQNLPSAAQLYLAATSATKITVQERVTTTTYSQVSGVSIFSSMPEPVPRDSAIISEFANWFYKRVNQPGGLVPDDFWPDANINLIVKRKADSDYKAAQGGANVSALLNQILVEHQLFLNPNTSPEGIWGRGNVSGLLLVLVCGTLHQRPAATRPTLSVCDSPLGVFENLFLLAQDPCAEDNWKIKTLEVILRSNPHIQQPPTVADSELAKTIRL
ncbi:uncharacterized protein C3orf38 homolog [Thrips palmi]|uniref:Uncharacterized protein C3orf38 homolog n=1 Tax=Thrips palmi TaxID=161013 RepID=A0A6P8YW11_THRPL|nr:uncharacterized protein C3orf38 homolog [Thrips palmi]